MTRSLVLFINMELTSSVFFKTNQRLIVTGTSVLKNGGFLSAARLTVSFAKKKKKRKIPSSVHYKMQVKFLEMIP